MSLVAIALAAKMAVSPHLGMKPIGSLIRLSMKAMTLSVSTGRTATLGPPPAGASLEASGLDTATDGATTEVATIELMRK
jgi:hypothetical protein